MIQARRGQPPVASVLDVAQRLLAEHVPAGDLADLVITGSGELTIHVRDGYILTAAATALRLARAHSLSDRWSGDVNGVFVVLDLKIPIGIIPPRPRPAAA